MALSTKAKPRKKAQVLDYIAMGYEDGRLPQKIHLYEDCYHISWNRVTVAKLRSATAAEKRNLPVCGTCATR